NRELEMTEVMFQCLNGNMEMFNLNILDLNDLGYMIDQYLKDINRRVEILQYFGIKIGESSSTPTTTSKGNKIMEDLAFTTTPTTMVYEVGSSSSSAVVAASLNPPIQQQELYRPTAPHIEVYEPPRNHNHNHNQNQQPWFMEMMKDHKQMRYPAEHISFPFMDDRQKHNHVHHHQEEQQHQICDESFTTLDVADSKDILVGLLGCWA
ncbi:hypothetical protein CARUB_v10028059mg, partial [Capsella rubella]